MKIKPVMSMFATVEDCMKARAEWEAEQQVCAENCWFGDCPPCVAAGRRDPETFEYIPPPDGSSKDSQ